MRIIFDPLPPLLNASMAKPFYPCETTRWTPYCPSLCYVEYEQPTNWLYIGVTIREKRLMNCIITWEKKMLSIFELQRKELVQETYWIKLVFIMPSERLEVYFNMFLFAILLLQSWGLIIISFLLELLLLNAACRVRVPNPEHQIGI